MRKKAHFVKDACISSILSLMAGIYKVRIPVPYRYEGKYMGDTNFIAIFNVESYGGKITVAHAINKDGKKLNNLASKDRLAEIPSPNKIRLDKEVLAKLGYDIVSPYGEEEQVVYE